ncbi:DUF421 domain-containing protein [Niastella populi]|uniref:DUF421 domain-containing protein n=1 Tax=Niastella populi TaxID=550983 RepID=A0A1V9FL15_9BACT|nr:YetF domain-containing protein [Niastella populi]OQP59038.1 hypothetical protein A4R26_21865 [Niastella populi]
MNKIFFDSWDSIVRTAVITPMAYVILIVFLRIAGKRTLSKMNAFDLIVTIALGSTLATVTLNKDVALIDGAFVFFLLILLQFLISYLAVHHKSVNHLVKSTPALVVYKGKMLSNIMRKERITEDEIYAVLREQGLWSLEQADAVILETDGSLTVIRQAGDLESNVLSGITKPPLHG